MDTDRRVISPARRSKRCVRCLFALCILVAGAYLGFHPDPPFMGGGSHTAAPVAASERNLPSVSTALAFSKKDRQTSALVRLTMTGQNPSVTLPAEGY